MLKKIIAFLSNPKENYPNSLILRYHLLKAWKKIWDKNKSSDKNDTKDMFDWSLYNLHFRGEIKEMKKQYTVTLNPNDYIYKNKKLIKNNAAKPMHPLYSLLYETIMQLNPGSILEMGCGSGLHLKNLSVLSPNTALFGFDRSPEQIAFLHELFPELKAEISVNDATADFSEGTLPKTDLAYTLAVIMHIHRGQTHLKALENLFNIAQKQVILVERWKNHNYMADIQKLRAEKRINWKNVYFYIRKDDDDPNFCLLVCSKTPLSYETVKSYDVFPRG